jgi:hypothetical protein
MKTICLLTFLRCISVLSAQQKQISCSPDTLFIGDTLTISLSLPHGGDFAVRNPSRTDYFLSQIGSNGETPPLFATEDFLKLDTVRIITNRTKAVPYVHGKTIPELVFKKKGKYIFNVSDNLETDDGTLVYSCSVYFTNKKRK